MICSCHSLVTLLRRGSFCHILVLLFLFVSCFFFCFFFLINNKSWLSLNNYVVKKKIIQTFIVLIWNVTNTLTTIVFPECSQSCLLSFPASTVVRLKLPLNSEFPAAVELQQSKRQWFTTYEYTVKIFHQKKSISKDS